MKEVVRIVEVNKQYNLGGSIINALSNISFSIFKGDYISIIGSSGSGKSTLMNIMGCLDSYSSGIYYLNSRDVSTLSSDEIATIRNKEIGFVFQDFHLLPRYNALENVGLPLIYAGYKQKERIRLAMDSLSRVGLRDRALHKPKELSGGQKQRVAIARAIVNNPSIILADEPTGNLDSKTSSEIINLFQNLNTEGRTIIIVTHDDQIAATSKRCLEIEDGMIVSRR